MTDHEQMILCALRYSLGRSSYIVGCTIDYIKVMKDPSKKFLFNVHKDIREQLDNYPDTTYKEEWTKLDTYLEKYDHLS